MISLKRYWDAAHGPRPADIVAPLLGAYRTLLTAIGISAAQASPAASEGLQRALTGLGKTLGDGTEPELVNATEASIARELQAWGLRAEQNLQRKTDDVKELLVVMARTASVVAANDARYAKRFDDFTVRLQRIARLEDLTELRTTLVRSAVELKSCAEQMSQSARESVAQLQAEVVTYQEKLEAAEQLAARDELTGLFKRAKIEAHIQARHAEGRTVTVAMIDLNGFKQINDGLGHKAGDDLLKQFSADLRSNARPGDLVGRWGGDEFVVVLDGGRCDAEAHIERVRKWVLGDYTVEVAGGRQRVQLGAAIGLAESVPGSSIREVFELADAGMYRDKVAGRSNAAPRAT